jgi:hypothetical protein
MTLPASNPPSIARTAFECPHCGAYTSQTWYRLFASPHDNIPPIPDEAFFKRIKADQAIEQDTRDTILRWAKRMQTRQVFLEKTEDQWHTLDVFNLQLSGCYVCKKWAVWVHDAVVHPFNKDGPPHHSDMPEDIARDYDEARTILKMSPRGAAALLRLCVQKLCDELEQKGKTIDAAIAALVAKGLDPLISQALDTVRVIGNEAVHPGTMDLNDNQETALKLFGLVNMIVYRMISHPKQVKALYGTLPPEKREAIDRRNAKALGEKKE